MIGLQGARLMAVLALFLTLLTPRPTSAASTCGTPINNAVSNVVSACSVATLSELRQGYHLGVGALELCTEDCRAAITELSNLAPFCSSLTSTMRANIRRAFRNQAACEAPSPSCLMIQRKLTRWLDTQTGTACYETMTGIPGSGDAVEKQTATSNFCTGDCGEAITLYLSQLENAGCTQWDYYRLWKTEYQQTCFRSDSTYCAPVFSLAHVDELVDQAKNPYLSIAERDTALSSLCSPCMYKFLNISLPTAIDTKPLIELEALCVTDGDTYCYPRFDASLNNTQSQGVDDVGRTVCQYGNCVGKMLARVAEHPFTYPSLDLPGDIETHMEYMCLRSDTDELCQELMEPVLDGFTAALEHEGNRYRGPRYCTDLREGDFCPWGCQRRFEDVRDEMSCCYNAMRNYFQAIGTDSAQVEDAFSHIDTVAIECSRPLASACVPYNDTFSSELTLAVPVPYAYFRDFQTEFLEEITKDVVALLGRPKASLNVRRGKGNDKNNEFTIIRVDVLAENAPALERIEDTLSRDVKQSRSVFIHTLQLYGQRCQAASGSCASYELQTATDQSS